METSPPRTESISLQLIESSFDEFIDNRFSYLRSKSHRRLARVVFLVLVTWFPILVLSLISRHAFKGAVDVPLLHDPSAYGRFLFVLPLLETAGVVVAISLSVQTRYFIQSRIVPEQEQGRFQTAINEIIRIRSFIQSEVVIAFLAIVISLVTRLTVTMHGGSSWLRIGDRITLAGWWYTLVSLPILLFFLLRWIYIFSLWSFFLFRVSRLDLKLTPTHPDHAGGLGFLGWGLVSFSTVLMAVSAVVSAGFAHEIIHRDESLESLKYHIIVFVILAIVVLYAPLLAFTGHLSRCRYKGLLEYSSLVLRHDRAFDEKWIDNRVPSTTELLLGSPDVQSLADIATAYEHVYEMRLMPFDGKAFVVLVVSVLLPMIPLIATVIPLNEIFAKLIEMMA